MGTKYACCKPVFILLALLTTTPPAHAVDAALLPLVIKGCYTVAWRGIPLGRINLDAAEDATSYRMVIDSKTRGIGALVSDAAQVITVLGRKTGEDSYVPVQYRSRPHDRNDHSVITLTYDETGAIVSRERENDDDPAWRPPVPPERINSAHDPVTASFLLRRKLYAALVSSSAQVGTRTYDGMRLAEMTLNRAANSRVEIMGRYIDSVNVIIRRTPIEGYTPKELKKYKKGDPEIHLYFSRDAAFIPVRATARTAIGELSMTLKEIVK